MNQEVHRNRSRRLRAGLVGLAAALALVVSAAPAEAKGRHRHDDRGRDRGRVVHVDRHASRDVVGHRHDRRHDGHRVVVRDYGRFEPVGHRVVRHHRHRADRFVVPVRLVEAHRYYPEYYYGRVYHAGHRHWHPVYRYPVHGAVGVAWTPYDYCGDRVHASGSFGYDGPRFSLRIGF